MYVYPGIESSVVQTSVLSSPPPTPTTPPHLHRLRVTLTDGSPALSFVLHCLTSAVRVCILKDAKFMLWFESQDFEYMYPLKAVFQNL